MRREALAFAGEVNPRCYRGLHWPPFVLPSPPLRRRRRQGQTGSPPARVNQAAASNWRYLAHAVVLGLVAIVVAGNSGRSPLDWRTLALDRAAESPSAFAHPDHRTNDDVLVRPASPVTQLVNRPREGIAVHKIQEGDTIGSIAEKYEVSIATVLWANGLNEEDTLNVGRQLVILPVSGVLHTVRPGEKLADIARRYQSVEAAIIEFNQLTDPEKIIANEVLVIPGGRPEERPRPMPAARSDVRPTEDEMDQTAAAIAVPAQEEASQPLQPSSYTVAPGDSLNGIAAKLGISTETLMWANGLQDNPEHLQIGQELTILPVSGAIYTVTDGDTLSGIAAKYSVAPEEIVSVNSISSADTLGIGQKLIVPGAKLLTASELAAQRAAAAAAAARAQASVKYTVGSGDTLLAIAGKYGVDASTVARANNLGSGDMLRIGQQLSIPGGRVPAAAPAAPAAPAAAAAVPVPAPAPAPAPPPPASSGEGSNIVAIASKFLGYPYYWGGHSPSTGFDCSGYVWYVYQQAGIRLPNHDLWGQMQAGPRISRENLLPGDIVFFQNTYQPGLSHNGIYIGGGRFINAQDYGSGVAVASMSNAYWASRYVGASRPWQ